MDYLIYVDGKLYDACTDYMDAVASAVKYFREVSDDVQVFELGAEGEESAYNWKKAYVELCNG